MAQKALHAEKGKGTAIRRTVAAAVFATAFTVGGCGEFPQCQVNYRGDATEACVGALEKTKKAKAELWELEDDRKAVREALKKKIDTGEENPKGLEEYNAILMEMARVSKALSGFWGLKRGTEEGALSGETLEDAENKAERILAKIREMRKGLERIISSN